MMPCRFAQHTLSTVKHTILTSLSTSQTSKLLTFLPNSPDVTFTDQLDHL